MSHGLKITFTIDRSANDYPDLVKSIAATPLEADAKPMMKNGLPDTTRCSAGSGSGHTWHANARVDRLAWAFLVAAIDGPHIRPGKQTKTIMKSLRDMIRKDNTWLGKIFPATAIEEILERHNITHGITVRPQPLLVQFVDDRDRPIKLSDSLVADIQELANRDSPRTTAQYRKVTVQSAARSQKTGFGTWLIGERQEGIPVETVERNRSKVGRCTILSTATGADGYPDIRPILTSHATREEVETCVNLEHRLPWNAHRAELIAMNKSGTILNVSSLTPPLLDDQNLELIGRPMDFVDAMAFKNVLREDAQGRDKYRLELLNVTAPEGTTVPGILSAAIIVIIGDAESGPLLALAHRRQRGLAGFDGSTWAVTIGEIVAPVQTVREGRSIGPDETLGSTVIRGLEEELLGKVLPSRFSYGETIRVHAVALEDDWADPIYLATVDLRPMTFNRLVSCWRGAPDHGENGALAAIPINRQIILECLAKDGINERILRRADDAGRLALGEHISARKEAIFAEPVRRWQQNSHIRLACALWYGEICCP